ncbi:hypothetical protein ATO6_10700 [Oceanicola sp. 22II-s10i]|nr:hypothetical protein ATO6_10700 [Oceanicola sp. 22II-s10i]
MAEAQMRGDRGSAARADSVTEIMTTPKAPTVQPQPSQPQQAQPAPAAQPSAPAAPRQFTDWADI